MGLVVEMLFHMLFKMGSTRQPNLHYPPTVWRYHLLFRIVFAFLVRCNCSCIWAYHWVVTSDLRFWRSSDSDLAQLCEIIKIQYIVPSMVFVIRSKLCIVVQHLARVRNKFIMFVALIDESSCYDLAKSLCKSYLVRYKLYHAWAWYLTLISHDICYPLFLPVE